MQRHRARPVAMITHSYYEEDPRVRREAEALVAAGRDVDVFALRQRGEPSSGTLEGVRVCRLDVQRHQGAGLGTYLREYLSFLGRAGAALAAAHRRRHYALVQVHSLPDFLVVAALPLRLVGIPVLLDLHEAMPEFFRVRFPKAASPVAHSILVAQERASIAVASHVLVVNDALQQRLIDAGVPRHKVDVVTNAPSLRRFDPTAYPRRSFRQDGTLRIVYGGALTPVYELDVAIRAIASLARRRPDLDVSIDLYGRGDSEPVLEALAADLAIGTRVRFHGRIPLEEMPMAIARADIGLAPTRRDPFTDFSLSTKIFEYAAMGKPVVCSRLPMVTGTFPSGTASTYEPGDAAGLATALEAIADDDAGREAAVERTMGLVDERSWERISARYVGIVERLAGKPVAGAARSTEDINRDTVGR